MASILVNYKRDDEPGYAALLERALADRFGRDSVLRKLVGPNITASRGLPRECRLLLAVMGSRWVGKGDSNSDLRYAEFDIAEAIRRRLHVLPVVVDGARMPADTQLSAELAPLANILPILPLNNESIDRDITRIVEEIMRIIPSMRGYQGKKRPLTYSEIRRFALGPSPVNRCYIGVITGDIRDVTDARIWVNGENTNMEMARVNETSISAIIRFRGGETIPDQLAQVVGTSVPVPPASAFVTGSGTLEQSNAVRHVIHIAAVEGQPESGFKQISDIGECVTNALHEAERLARNDTKTDSIIFPILGTGEGGGDVKSTITALLDATVGHLDHHHATALRDIYLLAYFNIEYDEFLNYMYEHHRMSESSS